MKNQLTIISTVVTTLLGILLASCVGNPSASIVTVTPGGIVPAVYQTTPTVAPIPESGFDAEEQLLISIYERVNPSVVNIDVGISAHVSGSGSGFVWDTAGHIVTNNHVVADANEIVVTFYDGQVADAELIGTDVYSDLAVVRVDVPTDWLHPVTLGDSDTLRVGQRVVAIGNPFGLNSSMTTGIISALGRTLPSAQMLERTPVGFSNPSIIQTDAAINPGNSGGPLLNSRGELIGVNTAIRTETGTFSGIGFAVPVNTVRRVVPQLIERGYAEYPWLGISVDSTFTVAELAEPLNLPVTHGVLIDEVVPGSPADQAGLQGSNSQVIVRGRRINVGGDIIIAINNTPIRDMDALVAYLVSNTSPGDVVILTVVRGEETFDIAVTLGVRPR